MRGKSPKILGVLMAAILALGAAAPAVAGKKIGKNPGKIQGRWLDAENVAALKAARGVYLGEIATDIQWKEERNEAPIDEELLDEKIREHLLKNLRESGALGEVLERAPEKGATGYVRLDADLTVEPGSRAARYFVGFGAGKSRSILEIHIRDHASGEDLGLYHGYGVGSGMGFKVAGGGARKMTQDDIQENTKKFVELLGEL